jgi:hypothetical protein
MISAITPPPMYICNLLSVLPGLPAADYPLNRKRNLSSAFVPPIITVRRKQRPVVTTVKRRAARSSGRARRLGPDAVLATRKPHGVGGRRTQTVDAYDARRRAEYRILPGQTA